MLPLPFPFPLSVFFFALLSTHVLNAQQSHQRPLRNSTSSFLVSYLDHMGLLGKMKTVSSMRVYIAKHLRDYREYRDVYGPVIRAETEFFPGVPLDAEQGKLSADLLPVKDWLRVHTEYSADAAAFLRMKHTFTIVSSPDEADICFCSCDEDFEVRPEFQKQVPSFVVPRNASNSRLFACKSLSFGIEDPVPQKIHDDCHVVAPYVTSVYSPRSTAVAPWDLKLKRSTLLCFYGGVWRGGSYTRRRETIEEMELFSARHRGEGQHFSTFFQAPLKMTSLEQKTTYVDTFFAEGWGFYAHSIFSWQPYGDSPTRRAFYDSWLFGCIPVISVRSAFMYKKLFKGHLFNDKQLIFEEIVVVLPDVVSTNGTAVMEHLSAIPVEEIKRRRSKLRAIAPIFQWGWKNKDPFVDPFLLVFATLLK